MSTKGVYTALSGAMAQNQKLETIANNMANVNTPGFKKDRQVFQEFLTANEKPPEVIQVPRITASVESFYDMQGGDKSYVDTAGTYTNFEQGGLKRTGNKLDLALEGEGFFEVATPAGLRYTRNGSFSLDGNGQLVTQQGQPVLMESEPDTPIQERVLQLTGGDFHISPNGEVFEGGDLVGKIAVTMVGNKDALTKQGNSLYALKDNLEPEIEAIQNPILHQGFVESSNINLVQEMTDLIATSRVFESTQKAIKAYDSMNEKLVNQVPRIS